MCILMTKNLMCTILEGVQFQRAIRSPNVAPRRHPYVEYFVNIVHNSRPNTVNVYGDLVVISKLVLAGPGTNCQNYGPSSAQATKTLRFNAIVKCIHLLLGDVMTCNSIILKAYTGQLLGVILIYVICVSTCCS